VYGVVWELTANDLRTLDEIEDPQAYERSVVGVMADNGTEMNANTYISIPQADHVVPDREYLSILIAAARRARLPDEYIQTLEQFKAF
jgi:gamma-glutamylcyclotransferase (GGCT)/AIG2-like uncharacterized protein YtfP